MVGHIGLGVLEHEVHAAFLARAPSCAVLLTVNDYNLLRRYVATTSWVEAASRDVGIFNAGALYMGLLADPEHSWQQGFKATLDQPRLSDLAREMARWCDARGVRLRTVAIQFALGHPSVCALPIGCRSAAEVEEVVESARTPVDRRVLEAFCEAFDGRVAALGREAHWYYSKSSSAIGHDGPPTTLASAAGGGGSVGWSTFFICCGVSNLLQSLYHFVLVRPTAKTNPPLGFHPNGRAVGNLPYQPTDGDSDSVWVLVALAGAAYLLHGLTLTIGFRMMVLFGVLKLTVAAICVDVLTRGMPGWATLPVALMETVLGALFLWRAWVERAVRSKKNKAA